MLWGSHCHHFVLFSIIIIIALWHHGIRYSGIATSWHCWYYGIIVDISTIDTIVVTIGIIVTLYTVWPSCAMAFELWSASRALTLSRWFNSKGARQMSQWNTGPVCAASTCLVRLDFRVNAESQESHLCGLSVEWVFRWPVSVFLFLNFTLHTRGMGRYRCCRCHGAFHGGRDGLSPGKVLGSGCNCLCNCSGESSCAFSGCGSTLKICPQWPHLCLRSFV